MASIEIEGKTGEAIATDAVAMVWGAIRYVVPDALLKAVSPDGETDMFEVTMANGLRLWVQVGVVENPALGR